jgi:ABC-type uncharacterized transport system ATPase component
VENESIKNQLAKSQKRFEELNEQHMKLMSGGIST